jgi:RNA polymerase sigma factor (sigma-70 family)
MTTRTLARTDMPSGGLLALSTKDQTDRQLLERFVRQRDEVAFEALVQRHGPMVLSACQRVLDNAQDAEDAFQATFVVFMRKAHTIRKPELLGNWLYGVAYRIARKARAQATRRRQMEREAAPMPAADPLIEVAWRDFRSLLDEELQRLPDRYRAPLVLCYLEGLTNEEAAERLGWPSGSMSYRLARGRKLLRDRLTGRHPALPTALFSTFMAGIPVLPAVPARLVDTMVHAASGSAAGAKAATTVSTAATSLAEWMLQTMTASRRRRIIVMATLVALVALTSSTLAYAAVTGGLPGGSGSGPTGASPGTISTQDGTQPAAAPPPGCH